MRLLRETVTGPDALMVMLAELRNQRPPVYMADEREHWLAAIGQLISGMTNRTQRLAALEAVTLDLVIAYDLREDMAQLAVYVAVFSAEVQGRGI